MGHFRDGQFDLVVAFNYEPADGEVAFWSELMQEVSLILHNATDGAHSIGHVLLCPNRMGNAVADILVHASDPANPAGTYLPNSTGARLWIPGQSLDIWQDHTFYPSMLAHELGHYLYGLGDEYLDASTNGCQNATPATLPQLKASLMESYDLNSYTRWEDPTGNLYRNWAAFFPDYLAKRAVLKQGYPTEFCWSGNHDKDSRTEQNKRVASGRRKVSCWDYITDDSTHNNISYGLRLPQRGPPTLEPPPAPPRVVCTELIPEQRFMLVLDCSGNMSAAQLDHLKIGANFWVDYVNTGEQLGIVSYSTTPTLDFSMSPVPGEGGGAADTWRSVRHQTVDNLAAGGGAAMGEAMRLGLRNILAGGRATSQVMILFTNGMQDDDSDTIEEVRKDLIASFVRCYTIGLGDKQNATLLSNLATTTGARYFAISGSLDPDEANAGIHDAIIGIASKSRENGAIVSFQNVDWP